jgi:hypothetical protein
VVSRDCISTACSACRKSALVICVFILSFDRITAAPSRCVAQANHKSLEAILRSEIQSRMQGEERAVAEVQRSGKELSVAMAALQRDVRTRFQAVTAALQVRAV